jgi:hypothetical protein
MEHDASQVHSVIYGCRADFCPIIIAAMMFRTAQYADALAIAAKHSCASTSN